MPHKIDLPRLAAKMLTDCIESPGWAALADYGPSATLLDAIPENKVPEEVGRSRTQSDARAANAAWCDEVVSFELSDKTRDTARKCLKYFADKSALPGGRAAHTLLKAFALVD